jgi:hypothetical protein
MRLLATLLIIAAVAGASPAAARDRDDDRPRRSRRHRAAALAVAEASPRPAPAPARTEAAARTTRVWTVRPEVGVGVVAAPWWWGWSLGWGYAPLYPRQPRGAAYGEYPAPEPDRLVTQLALTGAAMPDAGVGGLSLAIDGREAGLHAGVDAIAMEGVTHTGSGSGDAIGWGSVHATWSVLSDAAFRIRLELGGSMLAMPDGADTTAAPWAGKVAFGPDVGVSGQLGLLGPVGIEAHARVTPFPVPVLDTRLALAFRGGPLAVTAGWRGIEIAGDGTDAPELSFSGPELGLALAF